MTLVSQSSSFDAKAGKNIRTYTYEDFHEYYTTPSGSFDIQKTLSDGKYTTTYKVYDSPGGAYNYQIQSSLSTEPLLTHRIFAAGGSKELSADDKKKIQAAQNDPQLWANGPSLGGSSNWLFSGCTAEALTNGQWRISREYRSSGPAGWSSTLYST